MSATVAFHALDDYVQGLAITLAAMTLIAGAILQYTRKLIGMPSWFRQRFNIFKYRPILSIIAAVFYYIILIIPLLLHLAWVIALGVKHGPNPALPVLFIGYFVFGIFIPVSFLFYLKLIILLGLFLIGQVLAMTLSWDLNSSAYFCLTAILLTINGLLVSTFLWLVDGSCWSLADAMSPQLKEKVRATITSWKQENNPPRIINGGLYYAVCSRPIARFGVIILCYFFSILILLAYTLTVYYRTTYGFLGLINSICVISTDIVIYNLIYITKSTHNNPIFNSITAIITRICLIAFSGDYWFLGYCLLYLILMMYITTLIINRYYPTHQKLPSLILTKDNLFKIPQIPAGATLILFAALVYFIGNATNQQISVLSVTINGTIYPFWAIGVATILLSFAALFYLISIRIVQRAQRRIKSMHFYYLGFEFCSQYYVILGLSYAFLVILGVYMFYRVGSTIIWASCVFLPLFYQCFIIFYLNWVQNDYLILGDVESYNKKIKKRQQQIRKIQQQRKSIVKKAKQKGHQMNEQAVALQFSAGEIEQNFFVDPDNSKNQYQDWRQKYNFVQAARQNLLLPTDKKILISIPLMAIFLIAYSLTFFFITWQHTAFNVSVEILYLFLTFIPVIRYFSTLQRPPIPFIISFIIGIIVNYTYGILSLVLKWNDSIAWTLWWGVLNIFIITLYATFSLVRDKGVCIPSIIIAVISAIVSLGPGIILMAAYKAIGAGLALLGASLLYIYVLITYFVYVARNRSLHWVFYPITLVIIVAGCLAVMIYAFIVDSFDDFYGFSITYLVLNFLLFLVACYLLFLDYTNRFEKPNFYSPYGYPIYKYNMQIKSVKQHSRSLVVWYAAWIMFYGYTILMMIFIQDVYYGISASMIFVVFSYFTIIYFTTYNSYKAGKIKKALTNEMLDAAWQQTIEIFEGADVPSLQDLRQSLQRFKNGKADQEAPSKLQVIPNKGGEGNTEQNLIKETQAPDRNRAILELQIKIMKAEQDEQIMLVNLWTKTIFKYQSGKKKVMLKFTQFIRQSSDFLASIGVSIVLENELYDLQSIYNHALQQYNLLSPLQKIQFDKQLKQWAINKEEAQKESEQLNNKNVEAEKKRQQQLRKKIEKQNKTNQDGQNLPIQKMKDSPAKLKKLVETLKQPFHDITFRASNDILPEVAKGVCKGWKRPAPDCVILSNQHAGMSVRQGYIGDCFLISAIGILGQQKIKKLLGIGIWDNPKGAYMVKFKKFGDDIYVIVDDEFPINSSNQWLFGRCENNAEIFTNIIQKAYAKLYGGYQNIIGGKVSLALSQMTGGFPQEIKIKDFQQKNANQLFSKLIKFKEAGYLMGAGTPQNPQGDSVDVNGIVQGHAYIIMDIKDLDGNQLLKLRNPHGNGGIQSRLDWSDDSPKWTKRLLNLANEQLKEDGAFWISIDDFIQSFRALYICRIFNENQWKRVGPIAGQWKGKTAAGLPTKKIPNILLSNNPHYGIKVSKRSTIFVELQQNQMDDKRKGKNYIFFMIQKADGKRIKAFSVNDLVGKSGSPINSVSISAQIQLIAPSYPYTFSLMTSCIQGGAQGTFNLRLYCNDTGMEFIDNPNFDV